MKISLRVPLLVWLDDGHCAELLTRLERYRETVKELALFTGMTHPALPEKVMMERAKRLNEVIPLFKRAGLTTGINHLATLGHLPENLPNSLSEPWQRMVNLDGVVGDGVYCSADPMMQQYISRVYASLARTKPDFIWIDDDVRLEGHGVGMAMSCFCERCLADFSSQTNKTWTRKGLQDAFTGGGRAERLALRKKWLEHNRRYLDDLFRLIRTAVDTVDTGLVLGYMTCDFTYSGMDFERWFQTLAGKQGNEVKNRPGGGFYSDDMPVGFMAKAHVTGRQVAALPESVADIQYELENFPYQRLQKSSAVFLAEITAALGVGCTGVALNCLGYPEQMAELEPYFQSVQEHRPFLERYTDLVGQSPCEGLWFASHKDRCASLMPDADWLQAPLFGSDLVPGTPLSEIGLPFAYKSAKAAVTVLMGDQVLSFSKEELSQMLGAGVLMDGAALTRVQEAGLGELTGFKVKETKVRDVVERYVSDPLAARFSGWQRDCRQSFWPQTAYILEPLSSKARVLSEAVDYTPVASGPVSGIFENSSGGRVGILGYYPWNSMYSLAWTSVLKSLCCWLSQDTLPAYVESYHKVGVWCRRTKNSEPAVLLINLSLDEAKDIDLMVKGSFQKVTLISPGAQDKAVRGNLDNGYTRVKIPSLSPFNAAIFVAKS